MGLERHDAQQEAVVNKFAEVVDANYQMKPTDHVVRATANLGAIVITLPPVAEAKGKFYSVLARDCDGTNTVTIADKDDSEGWRGDVALNTNTERVLFYSDGLTWFAVFSLTST